MFYTIFFWNLISNSQGSENKKIISREKERAFKFLFAYFLHPLLSLLSSLCFLLLHLSLSFHLQTWLFIQKQPNRFVSLSRLLVSCYTSLNTGNDINSRTSCSTRQKGKKQLPLLKRKVNLISEVVSLALSLLLIFSSAKSVLRDEGRTTEYQWQHEQQINVVFFVYFRTTFLEYDILRTQSINLLV